jgi:hypothetical protein
VITWRDVTADHVTMDGCCRATPTARLHARATRWHLELVGGSLEGPANSIGHANSAALQALANALRDVDRRHSNARESRP